MENDQEIRGKDIFQALYKVNIKSKELGQYCIFIHGNSRTGKSTIHNLIMNSNTLIGKRKGLKPFFTLRDNSGPKTAVIGESFTSVTMMPNVSVLPNTQLIIVDFPGIGQRGNPIEVIKVNYINMQFFRTAKMVKFLLVFTEGALWDISSGGFKQTLENFLTFFNFSQLSPVERRELFSSIAICFTSVNFRGQSNENVKNMFLQALTDAVEKLEKLHQAKPTEMPWFLYAKELLLKIIQQRRIWLFQVAVPGQPPVDNRILQSLDSHNWRFTNLRDKIDKIGVHFDKQYKKLSQVEKKFVDENIKWRFSFGLHVRTIIGEMLAKLIIHFGEKQVNIDEELVAINNILKQLPKYGNPAHQLFKPQACTVDQRLFYLQQLEEAANKIENFESWKKANQQSPVSEYFTRHLAGIFDSQLMAISRLFGYSAGAIDMLNNLSVNVNKMLEQAAIFASLSSTYQGELKNRLTAQLTFGSEIGSIEHVKGKFIQYFHNQPHQIEHFTIAEVERIVQVFSKLSQQFRQTDPTIFSGILSRLHHMLAQKLRKANKIDLFVRHSYYALAEAAKSHMCFAQVPLQTFESQMKQIIKIEEKILKETLQVFDPRKHQDQIDRINQIKSGFQDLSRRQKKTQLRSIIRNLFKNLTGFKQSVDRSTNQIQLSNKFISNLSNQAIDIIINQYRSVMRSQINEEKLNIEVPTTLSFCSQVRFNDTIKDYIKGKNVVFVIGQPLCGKSVIIESLKRKKLCLNKDGRIDLERQSRSNRINHTSTPSRFPNLSMLDENEFIVEVPSYQQLLSQRKYINLVLLLNQMKSAKQLRILIVAKEATLISSKESKEKPFENMFSQIVNMLLKHSKDQLESEQPLVKVKKAKQPKCVITLVVNYVNKDKPHCRKILEEIAKGLERTDEKAARYLGRMIEKNQYICEGVQKNNLIAQDFQSLKPSYFDSSQISLTESDLYTDFTSEKELFIDDVIGKINLIKATIVPLYNLASAALNQFVDQKPTEKNWYFRVIAEGFDNNPIANMYETDIWSLPDFETTVSSMDNRPYLFHRLVELRQLASSFYTDNQLNTAYRSIGKYMENFFSAMVYLCCSNRQQYHSLMKVNTVLANLLKELEFYSLIFTNCSRPQLEDLKENMWPRYIIDATTNFPDFTREELMSKLLSRPTSWRQNDFKSSIKLLNHYISTNATLNPVVTAARIELLIFTQRLKQRNFGIEWNKELTEQKLIEAIFSDPFIKNNLPQPHRRSLQKSNRNPEQNENAMNELQRLKRKLLA